MSTGKPFKDYSIDEKILMVEQLYIFCKWFKDIFGLDIYLIYGTLLGAVREGGFISSDNDIDVAYLSKYSNFKDVFNELVIINVICQRLNRIFSFGDGKGLPKHSGHAHIYSDNKRFIFDVWTSWIDEDGKYNFYSMGKNLTSEIILPFKSGYFLNHTFNIPNKSDKLLEYLYSSDWKKPMNRKSGYYIKDYWKPLIDIYLNQLIKKI